MHEEGVGDAVQALQGFGVAGDQRFALRVGAGHHQQQLVFLGEPVGAGRTTGGFVPEQQMQGRCRAHDAEPGQAGGDAGQFGGALAAEDDGRGDIGE